MKYIKHKKIIAVLCSTILLLSGCSFIPSKENRTYTDTLFDTVISVEILDPVDKEVMEGCRSLCQKYDTLFSKTNENSDIYKINNAGGGAVEVSKDTLKLIKKGIYYSELSGGVFDITIGSLSNLWDFKAETPAIPAPEAIASALSHVNYQNIMIQDNTVRLIDPNAAIDVGAIAKGYIADRIKDYLKDNGVKHAVVNLGGNVLVLGTKTDGSKYNIGIQKPFDKTGQPVTSVKVADQSVVTTGTYQRYFEIDGKLYHHVLDPRTGYPCENTLQSVTIITDSSLTADAMSTVCFLLGYEKSFNLINQLDNVDALFITEDGEIHYSDNFLK